MTESGKRVAVVTGASSGIGLETAKALAAEGWRVIGVGRDPARCAAAEADLRASGGDAILLRADLSILADVVRLADDIGTLTPRVDVLVNNAGGMATEKVITPEGLEGNFASNHLGPYLLTERLLPLLRAAAAEAPTGRVRIVNTSSDASEMIPTLNLDDMQSMENWNPGISYCSGKLANVLHARALAGQLAGTGIVAHSMHPGAVASNFQSHAPKSSRDYMLTLDLFTPAQGADTVIWLATADEPGTCSGLYWHQRAVRPPHSVVDDPAFVARFREESAKLVASVLPAGT